MNYTAIASTANALLTKYGLTVTLTRTGVLVGSGSAAFVAGTTKNETSSTSSVLAQTAIRHRTVILSGLLSEPQVGDVLAADNDSWVVQSVERVRPAATTILYRLEVA